MADLISATLAGLVLGGFTAALVEANKRVVQTLWWFNCLAAKTAWGIFKAHMEQQQRLEAVQTENEEEL